MRLPLACRLATLLLLSLPGCGTDDPGPCKVATAAAMSVVGHSLHPVVLGRLRGQQVALLLDTGAAGSVVTPNAVESFGLPVDRDNVLQLTGIGGSTLTTTATLHGLELGHGHVHDFDLPIGGGSLPDKVQGVPVLGLFGADFLSNYDVDFDLPHHRFGMYDLSGCGDSIQPVSPPYFTVPFQLDGDAIKVEIRINGKPVEAELDSGAGLTYITRLDAQRAGVTAEMMAADPTETLHGVDESAVAGRRHRFASLEFGAERLKNFPLTVAPSAVGVSLLGDEFFHLNRIWISYPRRMLFIQPAFDNPLVHVTGARTP